MDMETMRLKMVDNSRAIVFYSQSTDEISMLSKLTDEKVDTIVQQVYQEVAKEHYEQIGKEVANGSHFQGSHF